ncbi:MAG: RNA polymerase factor sigma-54 [bacterium]|nr:RNA polymerase factor sigma-54 [bacterium]
MTATLSTDIRLQQAQILAPQMQQSLKILQTPTQELQALLEQQLAVNPALEEYDPAYENEWGELEQFDPDAQDVAEALEERSRSLVEDKLEVAALGDTPERAMEKELDHLNTVDDEWNEYYQVHERLRGDEVVERVAYYEPGAYDDEQYQYRLQSITSETTLADDLMQQFRSCDLTPHELEVAEYIVGCLDHNGFLRESTEELARATNSSPETVDKLIGLLWTFEPPGIGARDARHCLMLQLERAGKTDSLGYRLLRDWSEELARNRWPVIARKLGVTIEEIAAAVRDLSKLDPRPGRDLNVRTAPPIRPDVIVTRSEDGTYRVESNDSLLPYVRINPKIRANLKNRVYDRATAQQLRRHIREGEMLLDNIAFRKRTILAVAEAIVEAQKEFFDEGPTRLRPLSMKEIAEKVGVHEATVSRTVNGKYMDTPQGLFEMRYFFSAHVGDHQGHDVSSRAIQAKLKELIDNEDKHAPYSDQKLAQLLKEAGFPVARRTVVKYRMAMNIPDSRQRREFV